MPAKAAIVAVGSELLSGQITNRNAAWLSERLFDLGIDTDCHLTVDDVESQIIDGIAYAADRAEVLIVTGGLGPTSDDLTRQAVAKWAGEDLAYDAGSWTHIETMFSRFNARAVPESNKQQCYFPKSATVLTNKAGTANAFTLTAHGKRIFVLPGPPKEVETIWTDHVAAMLTSLIPPGDRKTLKMWRTIGQGESRLAEIIEPLVQGQGLDVAYRAHAPFVELKIRFPAARTAAVAPVVQSLGNALAPWLFETDRESVPHSLVRALARFSVIELYDGATQGHFIELLAADLRAALPKSTVLSTVTSWETHDDPRAFVEQALALDSDAEVHCAIAGFDAQGHWAIGLRKGDERQYRDNPSPYRGDAMRERNGKAIASLAAKKMLEMLIADAH